MSSRFGENVGREGVSRGWADSGAGWLRVEELEVDSFRVAVQRSGPANSSAADHSEMQFISGAGLPRRVDLPVRLHQAFQARVLLPIFRWRLALQPTIELTKVGVRSRCSPDQTTSSAATSILRVVTFRSHVSASGISGDEQLSCLSSQGPRQQWSLHTATIATQW